MVACPMPRPVRRFYFELVAHRRSGASLGPLRALCTPGLLLACDELGAQAPGVRVAALVELPEDVVARAEGLAADVAAAAEGLAARGVALDLWPQLPDDDTRFLNTRTAKVFGARLEALLAAVDARGRPAGMGVCLDVEPPEALLEAAFELADPSGLLPSLRQARRLARELRGNVVAAPGGARAFRALDEGLRRRALPVHVAVLPPLLGLGRWRAWRQLALGCPPVGRGGPLAGRAAPMCYGSMLRRVLSPDRGRERALVRRCARAHAELARESGEPLAVGLGVLSRGVLGTEPVYERLSDIAEDLEDVRALGFEDVAFYSLEGALFGPSGMPADPSCRPVRADWREWLRVLAG